MSGDTVLVGAYLDDREETDTDPALEDSGSVYVFTKPTSEGGWSDWNNLPQTAANENDDDKDRLTARLSASDAADDDNFGISVALEGDTAVIGAPGDDDDDVDSGSVYVFVKPLNGWDTTNIHTAKLKASSDGEPGDALGISVALDGDTAVVGAYLDDREDDATTTDVDETALDSGSTYVFVRNNGTTGVRKPS